MMNAKRRYPKGSERREDIVSAAYEVLGQDGYSGASLAQVGRLLGIERAHILYYFDSREHLLQEVLTRWDETNGLGEVAEGDFFIAWINSVRRNLSNPGIVQLYTSFALEASNPEHAAHAFFQKRFSELERAIAKELAARQARGEVDPALNVNLTAAFLISLSDGLQVRWLSDRTFDMLGTFQAALKRVIGFDAAVTRSIPASMA